MKKLILIGMLILASCSSDDDNKELSCDQIKLNYENALERYANGGHFDNCEALEKAINDYLKSTCEHSTLSTVKCNPYLANIDFEVTVDMTLPQYSQLQYPSNPVYVGGANYGNRGIIVINAGSGSFRAFDASDPNHAPNECSTITIDGIEGNCSCNDGNTFNLFTGQSINGSLEYPMVKYKVVDNGNNTITISN